MELTIKWKARRKFGTLRRISEILHQRFHYVVNSISWSSTLPHMVNRGVLLRRVLFDTSQFIKNINVDGDDK
jgi:hypothetical protein